MQIIEVVFLKKKKPHYLLTIYFSYLIFNLKGRLLVVLNLVLGFIGIV